VLEVLAGQVSCRRRRLPARRRKRYVGKKTRERERLAALGQMAATVAHEIKEPALSHKVDCTGHGEDESMSREYARDLSFDCGRNRPVGPERYATVEFCAQQSACGIAPTCQPTGSGCCQVVSG